MRTTAAAKAWRARYQELRHSMGVLESLEAMHGSAFAGFTFFLNVEPTSARVQAVAPSGLVEEKVVPHEGGRLPLIGLLRASEEVMGHAYARNRHR